MSKKINFRTDNVDYNKLLKNREDKQKQQQFNRNPFLLSEYKTDKQLYKSLYKFNTDEELDAFKLPIQTEQGGANGNQNGKLNSTKNRIKSIQKKQNQGLKSYQEEQDENQQDYLEPQEQLEQIGSIEEQEDEGYNSMKGLKAYQEILQDLFNDQNQQTGNKIQNAKFINEDVKRQLRVIKSGEDAISFFAKYGNTTPIKFIPCIRDTSQPSYIFRPYDLKVIDSSEVDTLNEYYTISAHGIVHVYTKQGKKKSDIEASTEVVTLSEWMHESTMFNIITNISFFKNYVKTKIFNIWKLNVRYRLFCQTRKKLVNECFICKPAFTTTLTKMNEILYDLSIKKCLSDTLTSQKGQIDIDEFKTEQKRARTDANNHYNNKIEDLIKILEQVIKEVLDRTNIREQDDVEDARFTKQIKQKPMNQIRLEKEERRYFLDLAKNDKKRIRSFIRLSDYMSIDALIQTAHQSMNTLRMEIQKENRKQSMGLFKTKVMFGVDSLDFSPDQKDFSDALQNVLREMIKVAESTQRVIEHSGFDQAIKVIGTHGFPDIGQIIENSVQYLQIKAAIQDQVKKDFEEVYKLVSKYEKCRPIHQDMEEYNEQEFKQVDYTLEMLSKKISELQTWERNITTYISDINRGILSVDNQQIKSKLQPHVSNRISSLKQCLYEMCSKKQTQTLKQLKDLNENLSSSPVALNEYANYIKTFNEGTNNTAPLEQAKTDIESMQSQLKKLDITILQIKDQDEYNQINNQFLSLQENLRLSDTIIREKRNDMMSKLDKAQADLQKDIFNTTYNVNSGKLILEDVIQSEVQVDMNVIQKEVQPAKNLLIDIKKQIEKYRAKDRDYTSYQELMSIKPIVNKELDILENKFNDRKLLWNNVERFTRNQEEWYEKSFLQLNTDEIEQDMKFFTTSNVQLKARIANLLKDGKDGKDTILEVFYSAVKQFESYMPIISALGNRDIKPNHWKKIFEILGMGQNEYKNFKFKDLAKQNDLLKKKDELEEISVRASGEAQIQDSLESIKKKWKELSFTVISYREQKDKFIIQGVDEIISNLDDHQVSIQTMLGTRFVAEIRSEVEEWQIQLVLISDIIDEWLNCQRQWMYLENIFNAEDIQKQLPGETAEFFKIDKFWKDIMLKAHKRPIVQELCSPETLQKFQDSNKRLDQIQKCLENYLETKRLGFPRFYFLSNDDLLEILSQTRNPHAVQIHLRKCFDNINRIQFTEEEDSREITAMISAEPEQQPEKVPFSHSVMILPEDKVENWLTKIENMMCLSLCDLTRLAFQEYPKEALERQDWLFGAYPSQSVLAIDMVKWQESCTQAIVEVQEGIDKNGIEKFYEFNKKQMAGSVLIVRQDLDTLQRTLMGALMVLDVHARDVIHMMIKEHVSNLNDFEWQKQLRYYWDLDIDNCVVRQTNTRFDYSYEYLGNTPRLVITPLTDQCYMTLTGALHLNYGGNPQGPAGTGKTETTKDLAKALAVQCVVFNCSDQLEYKTMGRFFSGLAQCGAWACFDEFNRIDIEVLSVIAQQMLSIQTAIRAKATEFFFEGKIIPINLRFGVFITMNPGYAGRTELPDNLKTLFRPISMMVPDYAMIAEIVLFSEGFDEATILANKMVQLYKLSSEQLSKQKHYDFGMRAVKSVLVMAGALRRADPNTPENIVLIRALRDSNVPKFLSHDLPLFMGIIQDLFPKVDVPNINYPDLERAINHQLSLRNFQKPANFLTKINQLMETIRVRHGVMLVGQTGVGKTVCYETLYKALGQLHKEGLEDFYYKPVQVFKLNPKSVSMNELYGYVNVLTNEWNDGIVAKIIRDAVTDQSDTKKWVLFDGPVDAIWIENMNTVLDDNRMLCLSNGQRIKLPITFTMMFEVQDLLVASPATVSRCGMVFIDEIQLGWEPILDTWGINFKEQEKEKEVVPQHIVNLIDRMKALFRDNLDMIRKNCKENIASVNVNLVQSCINLVEVLYDQMKESYGNDIHKLSSYELDNLVNMILIFSFIWSAGGNLTDNPKDNRDFFSREIKQKVLKLLQTFPIEGEVYDYYIDFKLKEFRPWSERVKEFVYDKNLPYFNILVPTPDTTKFEYLTDILVKGKKNLLISGETGVGKSVIVQKYLMQLDQSQFVYSSLNFSAQTSSKNVLDLLMDKDKFTKKKKDLIGPPASKKMILFIDDINMPQVEKYGAQPPIELIRQLIDHKGFYELKKLFFINVENIIFVSCCAPPGGGRNAVTPRLFRQFNMLWTPELSGQSMFKIFQSILKGFITEGENAKLLICVDQIVKSSVSIYEKVTTELLPTPSKSHYTFNLRDVSKIFQGILQIKYENLPDKDMLVKLWAHEVQRVFYDRLAEDKDRNWFLTQLNSLILSKLEIEWENDYLKSIIFGDYSNAQKEYIKIDEPLNLVGKFDDYLSIYNVTYPKTMNLVFFLDAISHLSRICRILRQARGNALLIGMGGSGRGSLTRLASFIREFVPFSIEITKNYKEQQWKDDLKVLLKQAGAKNQPTVFLFSDTQIVKESFLEDINNILNTGEVPNLMAPEDIEEIQRLVSPLAKEAGYVDTRDNVLKYFVHLVRDNLHIVLTFSPVGDKLRMRCRQFPSIINCCTIDWYDKWPDEALYSVAERDFKANEYLDISQFIPDLAKLCVEIHSEVFQFSEAFYEEVRRKNYVTPTSYLELIKLYIEMLKVQKNILPLKIKKYTVGLQTLGETNEEVAKLQQKIIEFQPILEQSQKDNAKLLIELEENTKIANQTEAVVSKEAADAQVTRDAVNSIKEDCERDLADALPICQQAEKAVRSIDKSKITIMKSLAKPPEMVVQVMNAVCVLFEKKENWDESKKLMGNMNFLTELIDYDVEKHPEKIFLKLRKEYMQKEEFNEEAVKKVSEDAAFIYKWISATDKLQKIKKNIEPKKKKLAEAQSQLNEVEGQLSQKMKLLQETQDYVAQLNKKLEQSQRKAENLIQQQKTAEIQLIRAEKLVSGLASEASRWKISAQMLQEDMTNLTGNILLSAAFVAYIGPFSSDYREKMINKWTSRCIELKIPTSQNFSLERVLTEEVQIREWQDCGLPADKLSTENGILIYNCRRWPLIIDPQTQANSWIKQLQKENNLQIIKLSDGNFLKTLENCIRFGQPCLLENVEEELDPSLEPILLKQTFKKGPQLLLKFGDNDIPYNNEFKFYITTKMPNPHYLPELSIKVTLINFTVTPQGLTDQLLIEVVRNERIDLEEKRIQLILQISQDKRQLQDLEDRILKQISEAQGRILDDEELINTLDASKITSQTVNQRVEQAKITALEIDEARESYRVVAKRGSVLYFVISDLAMIDPMYQYSLEFFLRLFKRRLELSEKPEGLQDRLNVLIKDITNSFYVNICRSLFEKDKLLFSFMIAIKIKQAENAIKPQEWQFFLRNGTSDLKEQCPSYISEKTWENILGLSTLNHWYASLPKSMSTESDAKIWKEVMITANPLDIVLPEPFSTQLDNYQKLLLIKVLREEKLIAAIRSYIKKELGEKFTESPGFDLMGSFEDSSPTSPIIFVLSPGADPMVYLQELAKQKEMFTDRLRILSLGQGQGIVAEDYIKSGRRNGDWVCLQNCHLSVSWLPVLERIQEQQVESEMHPDFRLWLTSMPTDKFPVPVLQSGIKLTNEPPRGLKANVKRTYNELKEENYEGCSKSVEYKKLLFSLAFFHAIILERRKYGAIGWNIPYDWMNSDFEMSRLQLKMYIEEQPVVPYKALNSLVATVNYGGRVTDDKDKRLIIALLKKYFTTEVMKDKYNFSESDTYHTPFDLNLEKVRDYINTFPTEDETEVFGLHANANITYEQKVVKEFMNTLLIIAPRQSSGKGQGQTPDQIAEKLAISIQSKLRAPFKFGNKENMNSLDIYRNQEADRFNALIRVMSRSLVEIQKAIKGLVVMSIELENMYKSFINNRVPENWEKVSYLSLKPLGSWVDDLVHRLDFFEQWLEKQKLDSYWVPSFYFPQGFMTAVLQIYARKYLIAIDTLVFQTVVMDYDKDKVTQIPEDGVNIHGLFLQGCKWDKSNARLEESDPKVLFTEMPCIQLIPVTSDKQITQNKYKCPLYKTSTRAGELSTTGHSTNFVLYLDLQTDVPSDHWIRRGVALLCQLDD